MDKTQFDILTANLDRIARLLALNVVANVKGDEQIVKLSSVGFGTSEIASMLGKQRNAVDQALHRIKKRENSKSKVEEKQRAGAGEHGGSN